MKITLPIILRTFLKVYQDLILDPINKKIEISFNIIYIKTFNIKYLNIISFCLKSIIAILITVDKFVCTGDFFWTHFPIIVLSDSKFIGLDRTYSDDS